MDVGFLHVGKTGGTAIKTALSTCYKGEFTYHGHGKALPVIWQYHPDKKMIFGYRDPVERFVSGFNSRKRKGRPRYNVEWSQRERVAFEYFECPVDLAEALSSSVKSVRALAEMSMFCIQHINKSLLDYLGDAEFLWANKDKILLPYSLESIDSDISFLSGALGLGEGAMQLDRDGVASHRAPSCIGSDMTSKGRSNIKHWYQEDYGVISSLEKIRVYKGM